jgi:hypothetical protein
MFSGIDITNLSTTYDTPLKPDKEKVSNGSLSDPSPPTVISPSVSSPYGSLQIVKYTYDSVMIPSHYARIIIVWCLFKTFSQ